MLGIVKGLDLLNYLLFLIASKKGVDLIGINQFKQALKRMMSINKNYLAKFWFQIKSGF